MDKHCFVTINESKRARKMRQHRRDIERKAEKATDPHAIDRLEREAAELRFEEATQAHLNVWA